MEKKYSVKEEGSVEDHIMPKKFKDLMREISVQEASSEKKRLMPDPQSTGTKTNGKVDPNYEVDVNIYDIGNFPRIKKSLNAMKSGHGNIKTPEPIVARGSASSSSDKKFDVTDNDKFSNNIKKTPLGRGDNTIEGETKIINPLKK
jgi:hypothetical protein